MTKQCVRFYSGQKKINNTLLIRIKKDSSVTPNTRSSPKAFPNNKVTPYTCYSDEATLTDIHNMISGDGLSICRLGVCHKWTNTAPRCQDVPSSHWERPVTKVRKITQTSQ